MFSLLPSAFVFCLQPFAFRLGIERHQCRRVSASRYSQIFEPIYALRSSLLQAQLSQAAQRIAVALTHRNFRLLWFGALTSSIGTWMQKVAQAWLIVTLTGPASAFYLGLDSFVGEAPILLFTLIGGVVADRRDRRHMMLLSQVIQMLVAFILAALIFTEAIQIWMVLTLSFVSG